MIKNFETLANKVWPILENDGIMSIKIAFSSEHALKLFLDGCVKKFFNPSWYHYTEKRIIITITTEYGLYSASETVAYVLSTAAYDYHAKKIQLL